MKKEEDYIRDITEIRSMMEKSSRFLSLSGWAGIMAGIYALGGAWIAYSMFGFNPTQVNYGNSYEELPSTLPDVLYLGFSILVISITTAIFLSFRNAIKRKEKFWNPSARRLVINMAVPLVAGGILILILLSYGMVGLIAPMSLIFYGICMYNASRYTLKEMRSLGLIMIVLGLIGAYWVEYGLLCWALGFGVFHIVYGIYMHYKYER